MSSVDNIYSKLFAGDKVRIKLADNKEFETLRTALCRKNGQYVALDLSTQSVLATYDATSGIGEFVLGESKRRKQAARWEILPDSEDNHDNGNGSETS
jgi:hypothetical protein